MWMMIKPQTKECECGLCHDMDQNADDVDDVDDEEDVDVEEDEEEDVDVEETSD